MAECSKLVPIIIRWEAGVTAPELSEEELFEKARKSGWSNDPLDSGGATMVGITLATYKTYRKAKGKRTPTKQDLKNITYAEWYDILKTMYWDKMKADNINNQSIANLCVNTVWGSGSGYIKTIQGVLGCKADGIVGPITLGKINGWKPQKDLFDRLWKRREKFFNDLVARSVASYEKKIGRPATESEKLRYTQKKWLRGWMNRLNSFKFEE